jgi:hypothetical protein
MKTLACVLTTLTALTALAADEPPRPKPLAGWLDVFPELPNYARTFEAPTLKPGQEKEYSQSARYEWTGGAIKSLRIGVVRSEADARMLLKPEVLRQMTQVQVGKQPAWILETPRKVHLVVPLGENRLVLITGEGMITGDEVLRLANTLNYPAIAKALDAPPRTDFTRKKDDFAKLRKGMSLPTVSAWVGDADADVGSGIHVLKYKLPDGGEVLIGFPEFNSLLYVKYQGADGKVEDLVK